MTTLTVEGMRGGYATAEEIVKGIDLTVAAHDFCVIIGPNGAGKSTFLKLVAGLLRPSAGSIKLNKAEVPGGDVLAATSHGLSFVPQERNVFGGLTVRENLEMGGYHLGGLLRERIDEQLAQFPILVPRLRHRAGNLSGGQRQILAMAIALMTRPSVLLLDEPTAGLSPGAATEVFELVGRLAGQGIAVLMVEQNALLALEYGTRGTVFVAGRKQRDGTAAALLADDEVRHLFLGGSRPKGTRMLTTSMAGDVEQ